MKLLRQAAVLAALLAAAMSAPLGAGEHNPPDDSSDVGRTAEPQPEPDSPPPPPSEDPAGGSDDPGGSSDDSGGSEPRVAVPRSDSDDDSHKQRPRTGSRDGGGQGGGGDGGEPHHSHSSYYDSGCHDCDDGHEAFVRTTGALDIDVSPGKTEVWIDGRYLGTADDFDGFPHFLWLRPGVYGLVLYREGYTTLCRWITVDVGLTISINDRMQRGASVKPQDLDGRQGVSCRPSF